MIINENVKKIYVAGTDLYVYININRQERLDDSDYQNPSFNKSVVTANSHEQSIN
jgi:hypothetical protein